jgi:hypothetical protein
LHPLLAAGDFLLRARDLEGSYDETFLVEVEAVTLPRSPWDVLAGGDPTLGVGRVFEVRRELCPENHRRVEGEGPLRDDR